jgi:phosphatidylglycerophosphatase C
VNAAPRVVAAFDFDGTLTRADTLFGFLRRVCGYPALARAAAAEFGSLAGAAAGRRDRDAAKAAVLSRLLAGRHADDLRRVATDYADAIVATRLRPDVVARVDWHRSQGHELIVVSASPDIYVSLAAARLGFDATLATRLEVDGDDRVTGRLLGLNVRGPEKVEQVRRWLAGETVTLWAYGNSSSDRPLLDAAHTGVMVTRHRLLPP